MASGSVIKHFGPSHIRQMAILLPPKEQQLAIGQLASMLEDQIRLLRETNATLEGIAQAIFKSWFIDFDPVKAKSEGRIPDGIDEATAALFPDSFEGSALGSIPKGWSKSALDRVANYLNGLALQKYPPTGNDDLPVIKIAQLRKGDSVGADLAASTIKPEYVVQDGDVLFSWSGSLEVELWCGGRGALNQHLFKVTSTAFPKWFYFLWTRHHLAHFRQVAASKATTMGHIQRAHLSDATVVVPDAEVLDAADQVLGPIIEMIIANSLEAKTLAELRDTLLPRLISGKLKLPELQEVAEAL
jgi:type I restriction enzyme S subunit